MSRRVLALVALAGGALLVVACPRRPSEAPAGPPPEYERPVLPPWDAGAKPEGEVDPFAASAEGGWVGGEAAEPEGAPAASASALPAASATPGAAGGSP